ncbi:DUF368 domain-containing protein [bacterium]|jgi:putative membrane protein|nr:DUF368 domain-containing protein [bacterium]MBT5988877.1 DUF368 domain-containing protein [bacterium]
MSKFKKICKIIFKGMAMGAADTIPGVSGSTIAVIVGIYDQFIESIKYFFGFKIRKRYLILVVKKAQILFLIQLVTGIFLGGFIFSRLMIKLNLLTTYYNYSSFFFIGLILGSLPIIIKAHHNMKLTFNKGLVFFLAFSFVIILSVLTPANTNIGIQMFHNPLYFYFFIFISGIIASSAMLVPGISGSFMLLLLGSYYTIINAVSSLNLPIIFTMASGTIVGAFTVANIMGYFLKKHPAFTYYAIIGLMLGSLYKLWPTNLDPKTSTLIICFFSFAIGFLITRLLDKK